MIGRGFLNRAARMKARSWVLSPISASATTPVEMRNASNFGLRGRIKTDDHVAPRPLRRQRGQRSRQARSRLRHDQTAKCVDASPSTEVQGDYSPMTEQILPAKRNGCFGCARPM